MSHVLRTEHQHQRWSRSEFGSMPFRAISPISRRRIMKRGKPLLINRGSSSSSPDAAVHSPEGCGRRESRFRGGDFATAAVVALSAWQSRCSNRGIARLITPQRRLLRSLDGIDFHADRTLGRMDRGVGLEDDEPRLIRSGLPRFIMRRREIGRCCSKWRRAEFTAQAGSRMMLSAENMRHPSRSSSWKVFVSLAAGGCR